MLDGILIASGLYWAGALLDIFSTRQALRMGLKEGNRTVYGTNPSFRKLLIISAVGYVLIAVIFVAAFWDRVDAGAEDPLPFWYMLVVGLVTGGIRGYGAYRNYRLIAKVGRR